MNLKFSKKKVLCTFLFCIFAFFGGAINGFLGTGGGIIFVLLLTFFTKNSTKDNYVTSLCATFVLSIIGAFSYYKSGNIDFEIVLKCGIPCTLGGLCGALVTDKINPRLLNLAFAVLIIYSGFSIILR